MTDDKRNPAPGPADADADADAGDGDADDATPGPFDELAPEDLEDLIVAVRSGARTAAEAIGFDPPALAAVENIALSYYDARLYPQAAKIFAFLIRMAPERASAWRGLGAVTQARKDFANAANCYAIAVQNAPDDIASRVLLGECLCQTGDREQGLNFLAAAIEAARSDPKHAYYVARARAIVAAKGGVPPQVVLRQHGRDLARRATEDLLQRGQAGAGSDAGNQAGAQEAQEAASAGEITAAQMRDNPVLRADLEALSRAIRAGDLTMAQIGGFSEAELRAAYACACNYVEINDYLRAMQILGWLMFLSPRAGQYYQLMGIIMHRSKSYAIAEQYYDLALQFAPGDPMTLIYLGEAQLLRGRRELGLDNLRRGVAAAGTSAHRDVVKRAQSLLRRFSTEEP